jgi:hypothetical protein
MGISVGEWQFISGGKCSRLSIDRFHHLFEMATELARFTKDLKYVAVCCETMGVVVYALS